MWLYELRIVEGGKGDGGGPGMVQGGGECPDLDIHSGVVMIGHMDCD